MISGNLQEDSSHLARQLRRILTADEYQEVENAYSTTCKDPSVQKETDIRPEGQSFNPKPARILQIMLTDAQITEPNSLILALESLIDENIKDPIIKAAVLLDDIRHINYRTENKPDLAEKCHIRFESLNQAEIPANLLEKVKKALELYF